MKKQNKRCKINKTLNFMTLAKEKVERQQSIEERNLCKSYMRATVSSRCKSILYFISYSFTM